jgi:tRNA threonylcarbamoyladenosine biosynthesis protein TsaB
MVLYIDTTDFNKVVFAVSKEKKVWKKSYTLDPHRSHQVMEMLEKFLSQHKIGPREAAPAKIVVNKGPGSYTGTKIGVTIALALGLAWSVPVKAVAKDKFNYK